MSTPWITPERTGHDEIDRHRARLFELAEELLQSRGLPERARIVEALITRLRQYFAIEEAYLQSLGVASEDFQAHAQAHTQLVGRLERLRGRIAADTLDLWEIGAFMQQWTTVHMRRADALWLRHLRGQRGAPTTQPGAMEDGFAATVQMELPGEPDGDERGPDTLPPPAPAN